MFNVIIIDDEELILEGMKTCIPWNEYEMQVVETFTYAADALSYLRENKVDIILTDIKMPEMDGIELIKTIYNEFPRIKTVILSGYNEFEYAQKALMYSASGYITKPTDEETVGTVLKKLKSELLSNKSNEVPKLESIFRNLVLYNDIDSEGKSILKDFLKFENYYVMIIKEVSGWVSPLVIYNILKEINISLYISDNNHIALKHTDSVIILMTLENNKELLSFRKMINIFQEKIQKSYPQSSVFAVLEGPAKTLDDLNGFYLTAVEKLKYTYYFDSRLPNIDIIQQLKASKTTLSEDKINIEDFISSVILADKDEKVSGIIDSFINNVRSSFLENSDIEKLPEKIITKFIPYISNDGTAGKLQYLLESKPVRSFNELRSCLAEIITSLKLKYLDNYNTHEQVIVKAIKNYIEKHYFENISLENAAQYVNISVYYLCHIFKEITGMSFLQYLINYRLEKARMLIATTDFQLYKIAEMVGYSDSRHFMKHFKRHFGILPSKIKKSNLQA